MSQLLDAALAYREAGLCPIPIEPCGKKPLVQWAEFQHRLPTVEEITAWWTLEPTANIALIAGRGMVIVDVDGPEGALALASAGIDVSTAPCSATARGHHYFFAGMAPDRIGIFSKVDVRGVGYVVVPPSVHETGAVYSWERPIAGALPPMPSALEVALRPLVSGGLSAHDWFTAALRGVSEGGRDDTATKLAGYLLARGLSQDATEAILQPWAERCTPPFPSDQVSKCVASIAKREGAPEGPPQPLVEVLASVLRDIEAPSHRRVIAPTRFTALDLLLDGGFSPGDLVYLGARPGVGKSAMASQIARTRAEEGGVLYVSREMTVSALVRRMLSQVSDVPLSNLKTGTLIELQKRMLTLGVAKLRDLQMWLTSEIGTTMQLSDALDTYAPGVLSLVVVDYLQLLRANEYARDSRARVEAVSADLKQLAVKHALPFLVLSSLSRPQAATPNWRPTMASLRESGELEHDADAVLLLHRDEGSHETEVHLAKQRDGVTGHITLHFNGPTVTFREMA